MDCEHKRWRIGKQVRRQQQRGKCQDCGIRRSFPVWVDSKFNFAIGNAVDQDVDFRYYMAAETRRQQMSE